MPEAWWPVSVTRRASPFLETAVLEARRSLELPRSHTVALRLASDVA